MQKPPPSRYDTSSEQLLASAPTSNAEFLARARQLGMQLHEDHVVFELLLENSAEENQLRTALATQGIRVGNLSSEYRRATVFVGGPRALRALADIHGVRRIVATRAPYRR